MKIFERKLVDLTPYEKNPRKNDRAVEYVSRSISEFGFKVPMVITKDGVIVCGHTRYKAAKKLGLEKVPCVIADDLTDEQIKAFRLADNKVSEFAEWIPELVDDEIAGIFDIDMSDFGFDEAVAGGSGDADPEEEDSDFDDIDKLEKHYGVPYQGNKSRIADIIVSVLPKGERLVDLFGGVERSHTARCCQRSGTGIYTTI